MHENYFFNVSSLLKYCEEFIYIKFAACEKISIASQSNFIHCNKQPPNEKQTFVFRTKFFVK